jgi:hypothetical protein
MSDVIAASVLRESPLRLLIADRQCRGIYMFDARDSLGGLPGLIDRVLVGDRPCQRDDTVRSRDIDSTVGRGGRNLRLHGGRDLAVGSSRFNVGRACTGADRRFLP